MLQFLKKSTGRRKSIPDGVDNNTASAKTVGIDPTMPAVQRKPDIIDADEPSVNDEEALCLAERYCLERRDPVVRVTKLCRRMHDILSEQGCMCYFVQYMESKNALSLVKFWLDVESFKAAAFESRRGALKTANGKAHHISAKLHRSISSDSYDRLSYFSVGCDYLTTSSGSEGAFEATHSTDGVSEIDSLTTQSCTPVPIITLQLLGGADITKEGRDTVIEVKQSVENETEICDMTIMRQSLTDDEKTQICGAGKGAVGEPSTSTTAIAMLERSESLNSLINSDAVRIYRKYLMSNSTHYIEVPAIILSTISLTLCSSAPCNEAIFNEAQQYLLELLEQSYLNQFLESSFYCKYTLEVLTSEKIMLKDVLESEMALFYFMEFLEQKKKRHYLEFYVTAVNFNRSFEDKAQAQNDALVLYEKYFSLQATCSLTLSDKVRLIVEEQICSADPTIIVECFELPLQIVEHFLEQRFFAGFLKSALYCRFISELLRKVKPNTINNVSVIPSRAKTDKQGTSKCHRKTLSDVTSDTSFSGSRVHMIPFISSQNTLLAMSDTTFHRSRNHLVAAPVPIAVNTPPKAGMSGSTASGDMMQIDSCQLCNPDLLWQRNTAVSGLTFGRVDALGRYERDFDIAEPSDDARWNRNRIKRVVRKLVNLPEATVQEELAWQVAEMIVNDITSVTMHNKA